MSTIKNRVKGHWGNIGLSLLAAYAAGVVLFPERFIWFNANFIDYTDSPLSYSGAFYVTNSLFHGGIQLWDRYDQMPLTFFNLNFSLYKLSNILTALLYAILSPFSDRPAQFFQALFSWVFIVSALCVRAVGVYMLLSLFVRRRWFLIAGTAYGSLVLCPQLMMGLSTNIIYSLFPLMLYFLLVFFTTLEFKYIFLFALTWVYCIGTDLFCGLGYLYQAVHFVLMPGLVWMAWHHRQKLRAFLSTDHRWFFLKAHWGRQKTAQAIIFAVLALVMIGPSVYLAKANTHDYEFGIENSRMNNPLSVSAYFKRPAAWCPQADFLRRTLDFTGNQWDSNWLYLGPCLVFFVLLGVVLIRDSRKWILGAALILYFLINSPRDSIGLNAVPHWINALTNPLKFLTRSFHMSFALLLPYVAMPLAVGGFARFWEYVVEGKDLEKADALRAAVAAGVFGGMGVLAMPSLTAPAQKFFMTCAAGVFIICLLRLCLAKRRWWPAVAAVAIAVLFIADAWAMSRYVRGTLDTLVSTAPRPVLLRPDLGLVNMDYQNPRILPVREYYSITAHKDQDRYLFTSSANMPGLLFRYTNHLRNYTPISNYMPRHKAFGEWSNDRGKMLYYLSNSPHMMFLARAAVKDEGENFERIIAKGLSRDVAVIQGDAKNLLAAVPEMPPSAPRQRPLKSTYIFWKEAVFKRQNNLRVGAFVLPKDMSSYYASTFLTADEDLFHLSIMGGHAGTFHAAQGNLVAPMTFDVNNVRDGWVTFALPKDFDGANDMFEFVYPAPDDQGLVDVVKNHMDDFGFVYAVPYDGWLVLHQPFDPKWKVYVDGKLTDFYKVNKSFIGVPLSGGRHTLLLRYWPDTPARFLLAVSIAVSTVCLFWILIAAVV